MTTTKLPEYDQLPIHSKYPPKTAWGLWGDDDDLGTLNLLTEERASKYIRHGMLFPLNWKLESPKPAVFGRAEIKHEYRPHISGGLVFDDIYNNFNTQTSTQWDGLRHAAHMATKTFYNNVQPTEVTRASPGERLGIHHMARRGIAGRAVLLDYARWAESNREDYDPFEKVEITVDELDQVAAHQGLVFEHGDILLIRVGWMARYEALGERVKEVIPDLNAPRCAGLKACEETFRWVWNHHFAAVASDNFPLEAYPFEWESSCHAMFLGGWGMPIGELFYLEKLADDSAKDGVYTYFFTSSPLNKKNGIASPPNAMCIK
ncbi:hypothetical protein G6F57_009580 [Rhizopus arrhizus]|uniref:Cyclase n=1 Tax=Rhizopus oryzae TaxID=64495 RepID=A0A9P7BQS4_RHIOR|nr:hypothetical protein G6F23_005141 [Rhizopus arrhizus]KAG1410421.1 hypothetical protein G6F58_009149 [Rhizopus delemar]KAG0758813.1 hypothetical protein G6F24_009526 [Rhizopus arrhizus]KAG0787451.1 hypothetical protein G6F21_007891 [Rhizopus arrhizus]KAG0798975.1 hypothetical protein G6F22_003688 [Rhizopus arrhizus]